MNKAHFINYVLGQLIVMRGNNKYQIPYLVDDLIEEIRSYKNSPFWKYRDIPFQGRDTEEYIAYIQGKLLSIMRGKNSQMLYRLRDLYDEISDYLDDEEEN